ncbi:hypothetical protein [Streptomyces sp. NPDC020965]|uniref:hypothetical protein n=1 Tax=Streptomyces sp. NPDC020965 TaxID=3365105 RepID=UPI003795B97E
MRRGLVHAIAWSLATGAAVTLSWWGVDSVMSGTAYDRPRALPVNADNPTTQGAKPQDSSTQRPPSRPEKPRPVKQSSSSKKPKHDSGDPSPSPSQKEKRDKSSTSPTPKTDSPSAGSKTESPSSVRAYTVDGGRVVFDIGETSAELVSATPNPGWRMEVWPEEWWIRVTFTKDGREVSVFCTWNALPPTVQFDDR